MTQQEAINLVISIAKNEVGYLEKRTLSQLDDKTANAGSANYTKYWRDIKPEYQGQPWCACLVTWVFVKAFGRALAAKLLKHFPFVYCPTMADLFKLNANPKVGDIVIFYRNGDFVHTGIVTSVSGDYFTTIEGNTSGGSSIVANGGGVFAKGYYNSNLPGTKFCTPDWSLVSDTPVVNNAHYAEKYFQKLYSSGLVTDKSIWTQYEAPITKAQTVALVDNLTGGLWPSEEADRFIHWCQPSIISLCGKGIITDKEQWLNNPDAPISKALLLALVDKATGGMKEKYRERLTAHYGTNCLDSLCDKAIIETPEAWTDFEGQATRGQTMALLCKAFNI